MSKLEVCNCNWRLLSLHICLSFDEFFLGRVLHLFIYKNSFKAITKIYLMKTLFHFIVTIYLKSLYIDILYSHVFKLFILSLNEEVQNLRKENEHLKNLLVRTIFLFLKVKGIQDFYIITSYLKLDVGFF